MSGGDGFTEIKIPERKQEKRGAAPAIVSVKKPEEKPRVTAVKLPDAFAEQAARDVLPVSSEVGEPLKVDGKEAVVDEAIRKHQEREAAAEPKGIFGKARKLLFG